MQMTGIVAPQVNICECLQSLLTRHIHRRVGSSNSSCANSVMPCTRMQPETERPLLRPNQRPAPGVSVQIHQVLLGKTQKQLPQRVIGPDLDASIKLTGFTVNLLRIPGAVPEGQARSILPITDSSMSSRIFGKRVLPKIVGWHCSVGLTVNG